MSGGGDGGRGRGDGEEVSIAISLSLPKVRNFAHFSSTFKHPARHEMLK